MGQPQTDKPVRFRLELGSNQLKRVDEELDDAPTYSVRLDPAEKVMTLGVLQERELVGEPGATSELSASSLAGKLPDGAPDLAHQGNRYELVKTLGEGGAGVVYEMVDHNIGREVAVKVLKDAGTAEDLDTFIQEGKLAAKLEHPNIIPIYDLDADNDGQVYLTMKKVEGSSLKAYIDGTLKLTTEELVLVLLKVCDALTYAHDAGNVHQDVKPENIMVGDFGEVFLIDWGSASHSDVEMQLSPVYMSPEQANGYQPKASDDIFCLGATLFHLLTKRFPTQAQTLHKLWRRRALGQIDLPTAHEKRSVPAPLLAIAMKAIQADPLDRYRSVKDLADDLKAYQGGFPTSAEDAGVLLQLFLLMKRRMKETLVAAAVILISAAVTVAYYINAQEARAAQAEASAAKARKDLLEYTVIEQRKNRWQKVVIQEFRPGVPIDPRVKGVDGMVTDAGMPLMFRSPVGRIEIDAPLESDPKIEVEFTCDRIPSLHINTITKGQEYDIPRSFAIEDHVRLMEYQRGFREIYISPRPVSEAIHFDQKNTLTVWRQNSTWYLEINDTPFVEYYDPEIALRDLSTFISVSRGVPFSDLMIQSIKVFNRHPADYVSLLEQGKLLRSLGSPKQAREWLQKQSKYRFEPRMTDEAEYLAATIDAGQSVELRLRELRDIADEIEHAFRYHAQHEYLLLNSDTKDWLQVIPHLGELMKVKPELNTFNQVWLKIMGKIKVLPPDERLQVLEEIVSMSPNRLGLQDFGLTDISFLKKGGTLSVLHLHKNPFAVLSPLQGMEVQVLSLDDSNVTDLSPLAGMPLTYLSLSRTKVVDLSPLAKMSLRILVLKDCLSADISTLKGTRAVKLILDGAPITDTSGLAATDAKILRLNRCGLKSLEFVRRMKPVNIFASRNELTNLKGLEGQRLTKLVFHGNKIDDISALETCEIADVLKLGKNPLSEISALKGKSLRQLDLEETRVRDLSILSTMKQLRDVNLSGAGLPGEGEDPTKTIDLKTLGEFSLERLDLSETGIRDITPLQSCKVTDLLDLSRNQIVDISPLKGMPIENLNLGNNQIRDLSPLREMNKLRTLDLGNESVQKGRLVSLAGLEGLQLEAFYIANQQVEDLTPLKQCRKLTKLDLTGNPVSDLSPLKKLPLETLNISGTRVIDLSVLKHHEKLRVLNAGGSVNAPGQIDDLKPLRGATIGELYLQFNQITDLRPFNQSLVTDKLDLSGNPITDISDLAGQKFWFLDVSHTKVTDFSVVKHLPSLRVIHVVGMDLAESQLRLLKRRNVTVVTREKK